MGEFARRILFGKDNRSDFSQASLPKTRRSQYAYLLKTRFSKLFGINCLMFLCALPMILWQLLCQTYLYTFGQITTENFAEYIQYVIVYESSLRAILAIPAMLGVAGGLYVIRMLSWGEPVSLLKSFFRGIRLSFGQFAVTGFLLGIFIGIEETAVQLLSFSLSSGSAQMILGYVGIIISIVLVCGTVLYLMPLLSTYSIRFFTAVRHSVALCVKQMPRTVGILLISVFPVLVFFLLGNPVIDLIGIVILCLFGCSHIVLIVSLYTSAVYDVQINAKDYPDYYRRGLSNATAGGAAGEMDDAKD